MRSQDREDSLATMSSYFELGLQQRASGAGEYLLAINSSLIREITPFVHERHTANGCALAYLSGARLLVSPVPWLAVPKTPVALDSYRPDVRVFGVRPYWKSSSAGRTVRWSRQKGLGLIPTGFATFRRSPMKKRHSGPKVPRHRIFFSQRRSRGGNPKIRASKLVHCCDCSGGRHPVRRARWPHLSVEG